MKPNSVQRFFRRRKTRKNAEEVLRHAKHLRHMREDLMSEGDLQKLVSAENGLHDALKQRGPGASVAIEEHADGLLARVNELTPRRAMPALRENVEVLAVAIAVAMGVRTYFVQPFKIPTGSMQPSLYGITAEDRAEPMWNDRMPVKLVKWLVTGEWYRQVKVAADGVVSEPSANNPAYPSDLFFTVAGKQYRIPRSAYDLARRRITCSGYGPGDRVTKGTVLWAGSRTAGDHVFVDKVRWNFMPPRRGEIMVFATKGITALESHLTRDAKGRPISTHYIKRMVGMPGERLQIRPPELLVNDEPVKEPEGIRRIAECDPGYAGYQLDARMCSPDVSAVMGEEEYFALGDNTRNSRDGRYWGNVPERNLVGPAFAVYWPFYPVCRDGRWGLAK